MEITPGKLLIVDGSSNNAPPDEWDLDKMVAAGVVAIIYKATQGLHYQNQPYYTELRDRVRRDGRLGWAAYHFAAFVNPVMEANYFRSVAGSDAKVLDSETNTNAAWQNDFLAALGEPAGEEMDYGSASSLPTGAIRGLIWSAAYGGRPAPGAVIWQFTDKQVVPGIPGEVDASYWEGTQEQFDVFFFGFTVPAGGLPGTPTPTEQEIIMGLPTNCGDHEAVKSQIREWWNTYRTDPMTGNDQGACLYAFYLSQAQGGFGGSPDLLQAHIVDDASTKGVLKPQFAHEAV